LEGLSTRITYRELFGMIPWHEQELQEASTKRRTALKGQSTKGWVVDEEEAFNAREGATSEGVTRFHEKVRLVSRN
jgi:hypothetical protein